MDDRGTLDGHPYDGGRLTNEQRRRYRPPDCPLCRQPMTVNWVDAPSLDDPPDAPVWLPGTVACERVGCNPPEGVTDRYEDVYLYVQLGRVEDGLDVHPNTLRSLRRRGFVHGQPPALTEQGVAALEWAQDVVAEDGFMEGDERTSLGDLDDSEE